MHFFKIFLKILLWKIEFEKLWFIAVLKTECFQLSLLRDILPKLLICQLFSKIVTTPLAIRKRKQLLLISHSNCQIACLLKLIEGTISISRHFDIFIGPTVTQHNSKEWE